MTARVRHIVTGQELLRVTNKSFLHPGEVTGVVFSPAGLRLATAWDRTAQIWDATTGQRLVKVTHKKDQLVLGVVFSPDGNRLASPAYFYNEGFLASKKSECFLHLNRPKEAAANARVGLATYDRFFVGSRAFCTLRLGQAHLQSGEVDEAARVVGNAAGLAAQTRSARLVRELRTTRARMQPWQDTPAVKVLDEQFAAHGLAGSSLT